MLCPACANTQPDDAPTCSNCNASLTELVIRYPDRAQYEAGRTTLLRDGWRLANLGEERIGPIVAMSATFTRTPSTRGRPSPVPPPAAAATNGASGAARSVPPAGRSAAPPPPVPSRGVPPATRNVAPTPPPPAERTAAPTPVAGPVPPASRPVAPGPPPPVIRVSDAPAGITRFWPIVGVLGIAIIVFAFVILPMLEDDDNDGSPAAVGPSGQPTLTTTPGLPMVVPTLPGQATPSAAEARRSLLTVADMPTGYTEIILTPTAGTPAVGTPAAGTLATGTPTAQNQPGNILTTGAADDCLSATFDLGVSANASFRQSTTGPFVAHAVVGFKNDVEGTAAMKAVSDAIRRGCGGGTDENGQTTAFTLATFPKLGDETLAVNMTVTGGALPASGQLIAVRKAKYVSIVIMFGLNNFDMAPLDGLVRKAFGKLP